MDDLRVSLSQSTIDALQEISAKSADRTIDAIDSGSNAIGNHISTTNGELVTGFGSLDATIIGLGADIDIAMGLQTGAILGGQVAAAATISSKLDVLAERNEEFLRNLLTTLFGDLLLTLRSPPRQNIVSFNTWYTATGYTPREGLKELNNTKFIRITPTDAGITPRPISSINDVNVLVIYDFNYQPLIALTASQLVINFPVVYTDILTIPVKYDGLEDSYVFIRTSLFTAPALDFDPYPPS